MLEEGISYPAWGDRSVGRIVVGAALWTAWFLLVPAVLLMGYGMRAIRQSATGADRPPQWRDWTGLAAEGIRAVVVAVVYTLVPNLVGGLALGALLVLTADGGIGGALGALAAGNLVQFGFLALVGGGIVIALAELVVLYLLPAALTSAAVGESIGAAFDIGAISLLVLDSRYVTALVHVVFIALVTFVVAGVLGVIVILIPAILFWSGLASARVLGLAYRDVAGTRMPSDSTPSSDHEQSIGSA